MISIKHFVTSTFTDLSRTKRFMLKGSAVLILLGAGAKGFSAVADSGFGSGDWTLTSILSGVGWIGGFLIGAAMRVFLKLSLLVGFVLAAVGFGLSKAGLVDLPFQEFGELVSAFTEASKDQVTSLQEFLGGFLPTSMMSGVGVAAGVTQKPDWTPDGNGPEE